MVATGFLHVKMQIPKISPVDPVSPSEYICMVLRKKGLRKF